ncbi:solute carrier organic anion transporter family member 5A1-like [Paramacrobiotus metropolitanus]|uniref:solute carrier organic anion transporter family member 5A1-like n=1 Tax=Paramacrobiotus metropolitanus TaxID=2943436 RepID=UPI0024464C73|nr:solute carrier organic anion transporter family member 5A1-like [Paramacrobiotus metropolitanus]
MSQDKFQEESRSAATTVEQSLLEPRVTFNLSDNGSHAETEEAVQHTGHDRESEEREDVKECGIGTCRPVCLQGSCASIKSFTFFCSVLVTVQGILSGGYLPSVISTLEKRYDIRSGLSSIIPSSYEMGNLFTVMFVSYLGTRRHIPLWMGVGVLVMASGSFLFSVPHFMTGAYHGGSVNLEKGNFSDLIQDTICQPTVPSRVGSEALVALNTFQQNLHLKKENVFCNSKTGHLNSNNALYMFIFVSAQVLMGSGGSPIFTLGSTYIDDHVKKESSALYLGCMYTMIALGPVLGFLLGGFLLRIHVDTLYFDEKTFKLDISSPNWIGAWWGGFVFCGFILLSIAIPFFAFPKSLSREKAKLTLADKPDRTNDSFASLADRAGDATETEKDYGKSLKGMPRALWKLLSNPIYIVTCLGACMELFIVSGFCVFLPKYLETQFNVSKADANVLIGGIAMPGACIGIWVGGWLLKKLQLQPIGAVRLLIMCNLISLSMFSALFMFGCDNIKIAGATTVYRSPMVMEGPFQVNLTSACNMGCGCSQNDLQLICGSDDLTYISPCHAGCKRFAHDSGLNNLQANFSDCSCIVDSMSSRASPLHEVSIKPLATTGACPRDQQCNMLIPFIVLVFIMSFTVSVAQMPILMLTMRSVAVEERSLAIGLQFVFFRLLAYVPAPIAFGNIIDSACLLWRSSECGATSGGCLLYDIENFRYKYIGIGAGFKVVALLLFTLVYWLIRERVESQQREEQRNTGLQLLTMADLMTLSLTSLSCTEHGVSCRGRSQRKCAKLKQAASFSSLPGDLTKVAYASRAEHFRPSIV